MRQKVSVLSVLLLLSCAQIITAQDLPAELQNPDVVSENRLPMRASAFTYESKALAEKRQKEASAFFLSLNGDWKFNWVQDPRTRPADFYKTDFNDTAWTTFKVPANWEVNGYGLPIYLNQPYEFVGHARTGAKLNPPYDIPADNDPVGSYRKKFLLPQGWNGRQVFIHLGAVKSAFFIWVNGQKVGYSEDSKLAAEFDITRYVKEGENLVALQVYRWSDGSYLECQDMWRMSGIEREVYMYATPKLDLRDSKIIGNLTNNYKDGLLTINAEVASYKLEKNCLHSRPDTFSVSAELVDAAGKVVWNGMTSGVQTVIGNYKTFVAFNTTLPGVQTWSAEIPYLYTLFLTLKDKDGKIMEVMPQRVGFRSVEIINNNFLVNGQRVFLKGVNRHEHNPKSGHTLTKEDMRKDMEMMKKLNVNAVRHSHYPPDPYWMELCDEYGLYVVDEANIESHGRYYELAYTLGNDKAWRVPHLERITRMYERDKNHPCVVTWSMGNEAGNGVNFYEGYEWLKAHDSRPVQYERAEEDYNTDMIVPQYPDPDWLGKYAAGNPSRLLIMSEYAHIMGNSLGNFKDYWDQIESKPNLQGGFIWEWIDQSIDTVKNGRRIKAYGGDFPLSGPVDQNLSDNNFCIKGVVTAHREMTPMAVEIKKVYQFVKTAYTADHTIRITNSYFFKDLSDLMLVWEVLEDGRIVEKGTVNQLVIGPRQSLSVTLPVKTVQKQGREYFLNVHYLTRSASAMLPAAYEVAYDQFALSASFTSSAKEPAGGAINLSQNGDIHTVNGKGFTIAFDFDKGLMTGYIINGEAVLQQGPQPGFYRAPTDNDIGAGFNRSLRVWRRAYEEGTLIEAKLLSITKEACQLLFRKKVADGNAIAEQHFTIFGDGSIKVDTKIDSVKGKSPFLMRMGTDLVMAKSLNNIEWYGRGPGENYRDRNSASTIGLYQQTIAQQYYPYARPQESGNKTGVRWVSFRNGKGRGLRFEPADSLLSFSALPYNIDDLDPAPQKAQYHSGELTERPEIYLHMDLQQTGVGGIDSWGAWPLQRYRIPYGPHQFSYWVKPLR